MHEALPSASRADAQNDMWQMDFKASAPVRGALAHWMAMDDQSVLAG